VNFVGKLTVKGDYSEADDCPFSLAPGSSCTVTVGFKPKIVGFDPGSITIAWGLIIGVAVILTPSPLAVVTEPARVLTL
jgi:hypothetical protein